MGFVEKLPFHVHSTDSGSHSLATIPIEQNSGRSIEVQCCTLADVFGRFNLDRIDYLKLDCEGAEYRYPRCVRSSIAAAGETDLNGIPPTPVRQPW